MREGKISSQVERNIKSEARPVGRSVLPQITFTNTEEANHFPGVTFSTPTWLKGCIMDSMPWFPSHPPPLIIYIYIYIYIYKSNRESGRFNFCNWLYLVLSTFCNCSIAAFCGGFLFFWPTDCISLDEVGLFFFFSRKTMKRCYIRLLIMVTVIFDFLIENFLGIGNWGRSHVFVVEAAGIWQFNPLSAHIRLRLFMES